MSEAEGMSPQARWERVEKARITSGDTQAEVDATIGISAGTYFQSKNRRTAGPVLQKLEKLYGLTVGEARKGNKAGARRGAYKKKSRPAELLARGDDALDADLLTVSHEGGAMTTKPVMPRQNALILTAAWNALLDHGMRRGLGWTTTSLFALTPEHVSALVSNELTLARKRHEEVAELRAENRLLRELMVAAMRGALDADVARAALRGDR